MDYPIDTGAVAAFVTEGQQKHATTRDAEVGRTSKLYTDCKTDKERAEFFRSGKAWESGIVAKSLESDLADVFAFRANVADALAELRAEITARLFRPTPEIRPDEKLVNAGLQSALTQVDATIAKLGLNTEAE